MKRTLLLAFVSMFAMQAHAATQDLINSVKKGDASAVMMLLNNGENVNGTDAGGTTALHYAVAYDNAEITQILLSYGADLTVANAKGWTPLKIAEKKDLKQVTPILVQYLQLQKQTQDKAEQVSEAATEVAATVADAQNQATEATNEAVQETTNNAGEVVVQATEAVVEEVKNEAADNAEAQAAAENENTANSTPNDYQAALEQATQAVIDARNAQTQAEAETKIMAEELKQLKARNAELEAQISGANKTDEKATEAKAEETKTAENTANSKSEAKAVKPVLQKKPAYKAPQTIVKKVEIKPSTMVEGIYAGDEEIVYCLDYLGNDENDNMKRAAGYYAASASISEERYQQIVDKANTFFINAGDAAIAVRDTECSKIITPSDRDKQNQIVRSMNKSVGY